MCEIASAEILFFHNDQVRFVGIDRSGSIGSGLTELLVDGKSPDAPWLTHPRGTVWQGQPEVSVRGESEPLSGVRIFNNEILAQTTTANANGDWTANLTLAEGSYLLQATAVDGAGNVSGWSNGATVKVDLTPPTVTLQATASGRNIRLTWNGNDGTGSGVVAYAVQAQISGQDWIDWLPATSQTQGIYPGEVGKTYVFRVQAMDAVGRLSDWGQSEPIKIERVVTKYYFLGNQRVAMRQGDEVYYLHGDHLGSVSLVTDSEGNVVSEARYTPYGGLRDGNTGPTDIGFTDQRYEASFGLNDYKARFYSPYLGRFISPDSIVPEPGNPQNLNRYTYVLNNPLKFSDSTGHCAEQEGSGSGLCTRFADDGSFRIVRGGSYFVNNTEVALANYILSGNSDYLNGVPEDPGVFLADSVNSVAGNLGYGDPGINLPLDPMVAAGVSMAFGNGVEDEISSGSVLFGKTNPSRNFANPNSINFSQRTVSGNVDQYIDDMTNGRWDWSKSGPIRVMDVDGQLISYDNRRLLAAQRAGLKEIPIEIVNPDDIMSGSNRTWTQAFQRRMNDPRNIKVGGPVPSQGLSSQPIILHK